MKIIRFVTIVGLMFLLGCSLATLDGVQKEIDGIASKWVPDKRVAICKIKVEQNGNGHLVLKGETIFPDSKAEILQLIANKEYTVIDSIQVLPDSVNLQKVWGVVRLSVANVRYEPDHSAEMATQAIMGTPVRILKKTDEWYLIQTPDRYIAWTNQYAVQPMSNSEMEEWRKSDRLIYTETYGIAHQDIKKTSVLCDLVAGAIVAKKSINKDITEISLPDGRIGYVSSQNWLDLKQWSDTISLNSEKMIATGKRFLGFPYFWGGTSTKAVDCSGFVKTVCFLNGTILERDASQQEKHGLALDINQGYNNLQKGDLLFFGRKEPFKVTHVGMYIGDSEVIHSSGYVHISSLDKNRENFSNVLSAKWIAARRIIGVTPEQGLLPVRQHNWY